MEVVHVCLSTSKYFNLMFSNWEQYSENFPNRLQNISHKYIYFITFFYYFISRFFLIKNIVKLFLDFVVHCSLLVLNFFSIFLQLMNISLIQRCVSIVSFVQRRQQYFTTTTLSRKMSVSNFTMIIFGFFLIRILFFPFQCQNQFYF